MNPKKSMVVDSKMAFHFNATKVTQESSIINYQSYTYHGFDTTCIEWKGEVPTERNGEFAYTGGVAIDVCQWGMN
jgi:hypothetical protein